MHRTRKSRRNAVLLLGDLCRLTPVQISGSSAKRVIRGLTAALLCLLLGCVSHVSAGGRLPGWGWLTALFTVLALVGVVLCRRRRGFDVQVLVLGAAQLVVHIVFHLAGKAAAEVAGMSPGHAHLHGAMGSSAAPVSGGGHHAMSVDMTVAHGAAALGAAVCLAYGDRLVRRLAAMVVPRLGCLRLSPLPEPAPWLLPRGPRVLCVRYSVLLARGLPRRGPPLPVPA